MNNTKRLVLGVLSCLLLSVGFVNAADRVDPINSGAQSSESRKPIGGGGEDGPPAY